jgi:hypothetical protein
MLVATAIGAILVLAASKAVRVAIAKDLVLESITEMRAWDAASLPAPAPATWSAVQARLADARRHDPTDPTAHEVQGILGSIRTDDARRISEGVDHIVTSLALRPTSPHAWALLAEARYRLGESGRILEYPLLRAAELGPSEPGVQRVVADYGLAVWKEITPPTQQAVDRMIAAGIRRNPLEMLQISERRGRLDAACRHLTGSSRMPGTRRGSLCPWEITP